jgi:hypothetical protein
VTDAIRPTVSSGTPCSEVERLARLLAAIRLRYQNLVAAALACLAAEADGEHDPLYYLRDELRAQGQLADDSRRPR